MKRISIVLLLAAILGHSGCCPFRRSQPVATAQICPPPAIAYASPYTACPQPVCCPQPACSPQGVTYGMPPTSY